MPDHRARAGFDLSTELRRIAAEKAGRAPRPRPRRAWLTWALILGAALATALAASARLEPARARRTEPAPAAEAAARPRLPDLGPAVRAAEPRDFAAFRNFAYFETTALLQLILVRRERERLAAEVENFRRLQAAGPGCAPPAGPEKEEDRQWVGLPPAPGVLYLDPIPEIEDEPEEFFEPGEVFDPDAPAE